MTFDPSVVGSSVVRVNIVNDEVVEEREVFTARLRVPSGQSGIVLGQENITVTIVDDDGRFDNGGRFDNNGRFDNDHGRFDNNGRFDNDGRFDNNGRFDNDGRFGYLSFNRS